MRDRANKFNDNPTASDFWWDELQRFEFDPYDLLTVDCAELADELISATAQPDQQVRATPGGCQVPRPPGGRRGQGVVAHGNNPAALGYRYAQAPGRSRPSGAGNGRVPGAII